MLPSSLAILPTCLILPPLNFLHSSLLLHFLIVHLSLVPVLPLFLALSEIHLCCIRQDMLREEEEESGGGRVVERRKT